MTCPTLGQARWKDIGRAGLCLVLNVTGATLMATGRALAFCGTQLRILRARLETR